MWECGGDFGELGFLCQGQQKEGAVDFEFQERIRKFADHLRADYVSIY